MTNALAVAPIFLWLSIVSWFDLRSKEVPHIAWVAVPLAAAAVYRAILGNWAFALMVMVVVIASCRSRLPFGKSIFLWIPPIAILAYLAGVSVLYGVLFALAMWAGWELGWMGGADSLTGIALALVWPDLRLVLVLVVVVLATMLVMTLRDILQHHSFRSTHNVPALPLFLLTAVIYWIIH